MFWCTHCVDSCCSAYCFLCSVTRVSDAEWELSSRKPTVQHDWVSSPYWWVTITVRLCTHPKIYLESNFVQIVQKSFGWDYVPKFSMCVRMQKDLASALKIVLWKLQNLPAYTKSVSQIVEDGHNSEEKEEELSCSYLTCIGEHTGFWTFFPALLLDWLLTMFP